MPKLPFAPELVYQHTIDGVNYYQFVFMWLHNETHPMFPVVVRHPRRYVLTVAETSDKFSINIRDEVGIEFSRGEFERERFTEYWKQIIGLLNSTL
jgi:hypothetical protein